ncbi:MAG TPA: lipocalin family protein [Bacteroidota bacterium]|jgi:apolipoprotein D and lipocalin family protein|nr:lipocalin family protein [Bacteroidota bacterium]
MKNSFMISVLILVLSAHFQMLRSQEQPRSELKVVRSVDLAKYAGTWYEIARLPNKYQEECACNVTATYTVLDDGEIKVLNTCVRVDGDTAKAEGRARRASEEEPATKLKVRFAPGFLSFLPFVWGDYWIIDLASDYSYAVIGEPDRRYLWILARTPALEEATLKQILERVAAQAYDLKKLIRTKQVAPTSDSH